MTGVLELFLHIDPTESLAHSLDVTLAFKLKLTRFVKFVLITMDVGRRYLPL